MLTWFRSFLEDDSGIFIPISWMIGLSLVALVVGFFIGLFSGDWSIALLGLMGLGWAAAWWVFWYIVALIRNWWNDRQHVSSSGPQRPNPRPLIPPAAQAAPHLNPTSSPDELGARAAQLGVKYANELAEFGDEGLGVIRRQLETDFGPDRVDASWSRLAGIVMSAAQNIARR
ncbi:MAG: hypothetical protein U1F44_01145 [Coriobacteriia bacterium]|nr:hypothetical protein [Coriobacteriia bacterium]